MYRFSHSINDIAAGDVSFQIKLRRKDYLMHERDEINNMLNVLSEQIGSAQKETSMALALAQLMSQAETDENGQKNVSGNRLVELRELLAQLSHTLGYFKTEEEPNQEESKQPEGNKELEQRTADKAA